MYLCQLDCEYNNVLRESSAPFPTINTLEIALLSRLFDGKGSGGGGEGLSIVEIDDAGEGVKLGCTFPLWGLLGLFEALGIRNFRKILED